MSFADWSVRNHRSQRQGFPLREDFSGSLKKFFLDAGVAATDIGRFKRQEETPIEQRKDLRWKLPRILLFLVYLKEVDRLPRRQAPAWEAREDMELSQFRRCSTNAVKSWKRKLIKWRSSLMVHSIQVLLHLYLSRGKGLN